MIRAIHFHDLLDYLAGQFFNTESRLALCTGNRFGTQISTAAQEFFTVAIVPKPLPSDRVVFGVLSNDAVQIASRNGYTFTIYIDTQKIDGPAFNILSTIILAHEICHFVYYYEYFIRIGDNTGTRVQNIFTWQVSERLIDAVVEEEDNTSQTNIDEHNIIELIETFEKYDPRHFTKGDSTILDFSSFFLDFLDRLNFNQMLEEYKNRN